MKKRGIALASLGIGAGVLYAVRRSRTKRKNMTGAAETELRGDDNFQARDKRAQQSDSELKAPSMAAVKEDEANPRSEHFELDDRGTSQDEARDLLTQIKVGLFHSSDEKLALALGRTVDEIQAVTNREQTVDSDLLFKARALAEERGLNVEA